MMRSTTRFLAVLAALCLLATTAQAARPDSPGNGNGNGNGGGPKTCDAADVSAAAAAIAAACPCDGLADQDGNVVPWKNHGKYVRCVAKATRSAVKAADGALSRRCLKDSMRCAARSTCGKPEGSVTCTSATTSACVGGLCDDASACTTDDDCTESSCSFRRSVDECTTGGGVAGVGSCCAPAPIGSPSGAFVDGVQHF